MSKIKINEIESASTDLTVTPTGTDGTLEVANEDQQSSIQFNDSLDIHKVKVKGPVNTASQDYTLVLPATNITADKYLKVDSLTGSGSTAIAHLGYHTVTPADENNLVGDHLTSGTFPAAYYNFPATQGGGLKHYQTQTVDVSGEYISVTFNNLPEGMYKWFMRGWKAVGWDAAASEGGTLQSSSPQGGPRMYLLDQNGNTINGNSRLKWDHLYYDGDYNSSDGNASYVYLDLGNGQDNLFVGEFYTAEPTVAYRNPCFGFQRGTAGGASYNRHRGAWSLSGFDTTSEYFHRVHGIKFQVDYIQITYFYFIEAGLSIDLYRYDET